MQGLAPEPIEDAEVEPKITKPLPVSPKSVSDDPESKLTLQASISKPTEETAPTQAKPEVAKLDPVLPRPMEEGLTAPPLVTLVPEFLRLDIVPEFPLLWRSYQAASVALTSLLTADSATKGDILVNAKVEKYELALIRL